MKEIKISINFIVKTADCKMETIIACYKKFFNEKNKAIIG